jgi:hypothetical protein
MAASSNGKYQPEQLLEMFRMAAIMRNHMIDAGFTDNGGAIHTASRILDILGSRLNYPDIRHVNSLKNSEFAEFSESAWALNKREEKIFIEHVAPLRALTRAAIRLTDKGCGDEEFICFLKSNYRLALLSPEETQKLNKKNRTKMQENRLQDSGIEVYPRHFFLC